MRTPLARPSLLAAAALSLAACESTTIVDSDFGPGEPRDFRAEYQWVLEGWDGTSPVGHPVAALSWRPPSDWDREAFRVYGRRAGSSTWLLIATVTSCIDRLCVYDDVNVAPGTTYEFYVATVDERSGDETATEFAETVRVPSASRPSAPAADSVVALDDAAYVTWTATANSQEIWKHLVYITQVDGAASLYQVGETDGEGFLDERAQNGAEYGYRIATVDTLGHVSDLSAEIRGVPRPDASGELIYAHADDPTRSGFRFRADEGSDPIVSGTSTSAHWRLEVGTGGWRIVPLNGTQVLEWGLTTALTCGPGADASCVAVTRAPSTGYSSSAVSVDPEFSYVFRVTGDDGRTHYGVVRAVILGSDAAGDDLMIFDWAYQTRADEPRLNALPR